MYRIGGGSMTAAVAAAAALVVGGCVEAEGVIGIGSTQHCTHIVFAGWELCLHRIVSVMSYG